MTTTYRDQRPAGGCTNCGGPVRTRKQGYGWVCAACVRLLEQDQRREGDPMGAIRARVAELEAVREATDDEATARVAADEIGRLLDEIDNVRELRR